MTLNILFRLLLRSFSVLSSICVIRSPMVMFQRNIVKKVKIASWKIKELGLQNQDFPRLNCYQIHDVDEMEVPQLWDV